jgi:hypothetical protein
MIVIFLKKKDKEEEEVEVEVEIYKKNQMFKKHKSEIV